MSSCELPNLRNNYTLFSDAAEEMQKLQRDKEKEKKKRSKDKKKQKEEQDALDSAEAEVALAKQKAAMVQDGNNRKVRSRNLKMPSGLPSVA